ncbi:hypothetical protein P3G55_14955 [Leptospira sp. 96542]|nr:hypothetical protein [Leptospira sp. 96542]
MFRRIVQIFGVSLLTLSLGVAFLSEESVFVRTRTTKSFRSGGKLSQVSGSSISTSSAQITSEENAGSKGFEGNVSGNANHFFSSKVIILTPHSAVRAAFLSNLLSHRYLSLPPPV